MTCERRNHQRIRPRLRSEISNPEGEVGIPSSKTQSGTRHILVVHHL